MQNRKKHLVVIQENDQQENNSNTCFSMQEKYGVSCQRTNCHQWVENSEYHNCVMIAAKNGPHTLQKIGQIYGLTRMRICQIEKNIFEKIRKIS